MILDTNNIMDCLEFGKRRFPADRESERFWENAIWDLIELRKRVDAVVAERDALRAALADYFAERDGEVGTYAPTDETEAKMRAVLAGEAAPPPGKTGEANLGASTARSSEGKS